MKSVPDRRADPALLDAGASVVAVERDRRCIPALDELREEFGDRLQIIEGDALKIDEEAIVGEGAHVVANLPYNIGTALAPQMAGRRTGRHGGAH